jgi:hypothetical protein
MSERSKKAIELCRSEGKAWSLRDFEKGAPAELDPIFGLVAAHKTAWAQFVELDERDPETFEEGGRAADAAMYELMNTPPTTLAGMRAIIQYLIDLDDDTGYYYLPTLLRSPLLGA